MYQKQFAEYFDKHMEEILRDLDEIISIESIGDINAPVKPFGEGSRKALNWGKAYLEKLGMTTKDFDGYAVHGDFYPEGECKLAVLSHLDTVPAGEGWSYPPFKLTKADGKLFGRGTIDDKGPSVAVLWAVKAIKELNIPIKKNFRVIFGGGCRSAAAQKKCHTYKCCNQSFHLASCSFSSSISASTSPVISNREPENLRLPPFNWQTNWGGSVLRKVMLPPIRSKSSGIRSTRIFAFSYMVRVTRSGRVCTSLI